MRHYIEWTMNLYEWYRHVVGFSYHNTTSDGKYQCLDLYWQRPEMLYKSWWVWYNITDQNEPEQYWRGVAITFQGMRNLGDEPPPQPTRHLFAFGVLPP